MLEIPESRTIAEQLRETLTGKTIRSVHANTTPHGFAFYFGDPAEYQQRLAGKTVDGAEALAGQVELRAGTARLLFGDGVNIRYYVAGEKLPARHQLHLEFDDGSSIVCTVQMYGGIWAFTDGENDNPYYLVTMEKPSPLSDDFTQQYFESLAQGLKPSLSVKAFLATEQRIPGLGNGVLQDILFRAGIHPKTHLVKLSREQMDKLYDSVRQTLFDMTSRGGRDTEKDLFGCHGGYKCILSKNTLKAPCPVCGGELVRQAYLGGNIYFCPTCQPVVKD